MRTHPNARTTLEALNRVSDEERIEEVVRAVGISRATVYNTLNTLRDLGAITEVSVGTKHTHYETDTSPHINLICLVCGSVIDYDGHLPLTEAQSRLTTETGFVPVAGKIELMGFCGSCRQRRLEEIRLLARSEGQQRGNRNDI